MHNLTSYNLAGKAALVTGGASGIGLAVTTQIARNGGSVAVNYLPDDARGPETIAQLQAQGLKVIGAPGNVAIAGDAERMVNQAIQDLGRLDFLHANAGTPASRRQIQPRELDMMTEEFWTTILQTNLLGVFRCAHAAAAALKTAGGAIVSTASIAGINRAGSSLAYGAAKAGVINMTQNLARALAPDVRVNAVAPGAVDSSWMVEWSNEERNASIDRALLKRRCTTDDIAEVVLFLGFGAAMVTGQTITVDGGLTL